VSAFWNVNAVTRFSLAAHGSVLTAFEALFFDPRDGTEPDAVEAFRADLPWENADSVALMLALAARVIGQVNEPHWLAGDLRVVP
jgi:Family of unknown function (DUF6461)